MSTESRRQIAFLRCQFSVPSMNFLCPCGEYKFLSVTPFEKTPIISVLEEIQVTKKQPRSRQTPVFVGLTLGH